MKKVFLKKVCVDFSGHEPDTTLPNQFTRLRALFKAPGGEKFRVVDRYQQDGKGELAIFTRGMSIKVPPSSAVEAHVVALGRELIMRAYNQGQPVGYTGAPRGQQVVHNLRIEGESIDYVDFMGGTNEASMLMFCYEPLQPVKGTSLVSSDESQGKKICCYKGAVSLDPDEKPGKWKGYLFAQTVNVVPEGTPPEKAAQILGGVGVTQNMEDARKVAGSLIVCGGHDIVDFMFQVV